MKNLCEFHYLDELTWWALSLLLRRRSSVIRCAFHHTSSIQSATNEYATSQIHVKSDIESAAGNSVDSSLRNYLIRGNRINCQTNHSKQTSFPITVLPVAWGGNSLQWEWHGIKLAVSISLPIGSQNKLLLIWLVPRMCQSKLHTLTNKLWQRLLLSSKAPSCAYAI